MINTRPWYVAVRPIGLEGYTRARRAVEHMQNPSTVALHL